MIAEAAEQREKNKTKHFDHSWNTFCWLLSRGIDFMASITFYSTELRKEPWSDTEPCCQEKSKRLWADIFIPYFLSLSLSLSFFRLYMRENANSLGGTVGNLLASVALGFWAWDEYNPYGYMASLNTFYIPCNADFESVCVCVYHTVIWVSLITAFFMFLFHCK